MKKLIMICLLISALFFISACSNTKKTPLTIDYDSEKDICNITNINDKQDLEGLTVKVVLETSDNFKKEIEFKVGNLEAGKTYEGNLGSISSDMKISNVYISSYDHDGTLFRSIVVMILLSLVIVGLVMCIGSIS